MNFNDLVQLIEAINPYSDLSPEEAYDKAVELGKRVPELETIILQSPLWIVMYADIFKIKWPEGEKALLERGSPMIVAGYVKLVKKERWLEAEPIIKKNSNVWKEYENFISSLSDDNDIPEEY
jgi:hypothetical protein